MMFYNHTNRNNMDRVHIQRIKNKKLIKKKKKLIKQA